MSALVKTIKSRLTDDTIYPITKADAVYMGSSTVTTAETQINNLKDVIGNSNIGESNTITSFIGNITMGTTASTITGAIAELNDDLSVIQKRYTYQFTVAGNAVIQISGTNLGFDIDPPSGYAKIGVKRIGVGSANSSLQYGFNGNASGGNFTSVKNTSSSSLTDTLTVDMIYIKTNIITQITS